MHPTKTPEPRHQKKFEFIPVSGKTRRTDPETLRRVHSYTQAEYRRRHVSSHQRKTVELDVTPLLDRSLVQHHGYSLRTCLDNARSDPFHSFKLGEDGRAHRLWDHVYDGTCAKFRTLIAIGFIDRVRETIALSQMLSASAWHLVHWLRCEDDVGDDARYSMITTRSLQNQLNNLATGTSDEVITAVLACAAYANLVRDPQTFQVHMDGLSQIFRCRGGERALDSLGHLRLSLFWIEVNGRLQQDAPAQYPLPYHILAPQSKLNLIEADLGRISLRENFSSLDESYMVKYGMQQLIHLGQIIDASIVPWDDPLFPVFHIFPLLHNFLSISRASVHDSVLLRQKECFRLFGIIYLLSFRSIIDFEPGAGMLHGTKLQLLLETLEPGDELSPILLWGLVVCVCTRVLFDELRSHFRVVLDRYLQVAGITRFEELLEAIWELPWCRGVFGYAWNYLSQSLFRSIE